MYVDKRAQFKTKMTERQKWPMSEENEKSINKKQNNFYRLHVSLHNQLFIL